MTAPANELQDAIIAAVKGDAALMGMVAGIYDSVFDDAYGTKTAYLSIGSESMNPGEHECLKAEDHVVQIDVWSKAIGRMECKEISHSLKALLHGVALALPENACIQGRLILSQIMPDPDPEVTHGVLQFQYDLEDLT